MKEILEVRTSEEMEEVFMMERVLLFKNSTRCGISQRALRELREFAREAPEDLEIRMVDVNERKELSDVFEEKTGIPHKSPQAVYLENGKPVWDASHFEINEKNLRNATDKR